MENFTCITQPEGTYLDLFTLPKKEGKGIIIAIELHHLVKKYFAEHSFIFIGSDGTSVNTGYKSGMNACFAFHQIFLLKLQ